MEVTGGIHDMEVTGGIHAMLMFGVDVGGTFTDVVVFDEETGEITAGKVPSTPANQAVGFGNGLKALGVDAKKVRRALHGTTVATNSAIERKGSRTIGLFTKGFRDVIAIGSGQRFTGGLFNPHFRKEPPLIPRSLRLELDERMSHRGEILIGLKQEALKSIAKVIGGLDGEAVAVCFLHAYVNDRHERDAVAFLRESFPDKFICGSAEVLPQAKEFERFTTTVFNAYLGPTMRHYLSRLREWLKDEGYDQELLIMTNNGGVSSAAQVAQFPVTAVLSGPAGGVAAGLVLSAQIGSDNFITYDMGGTSTDVCLIKNGKPESAAQRIVSGLPLKIPQLAINTVGAGGGSVAWVDKDGRFAVGPQSAGAVPGPACYGCGGQDPTVTDANLVLNRIGSATCLGGFLTLDRDLAVAAVARIAEKMGYEDLNFVAEGILRVAESKMSAAIREISVERGEDPREFTLIAFGGAGPMHGCAVAQDLGITRVISPNYPGNFSALGLLMSDLRHELVRTHLSLLEDIETETVSQRFQQMSAEAHAILASENVATIDRDVRFFLGLRYEGQAHEIDLQVDPNLINKAAVYDAFTKRYLEMWSHSPEGRPVQLVTLRVIAVGRAPKLPLRRVTRGTQTLVQSKIGERNVYFSGKSREAAVYKRTLLPIETAIRGPAIIEEDGSTTVVFPEWNAQVDGFGNIILSACA
jgi:N-methylhydantoinase A